MKRYYYFVFICLLQFLIYKPLHLNAQTKDAPANVVAPMLVKIAELEKNISSGGDIIIYVMNNSEYATEFKKAIGKKVGSATVKDVLEGTGLPDQKPTILVVGDASSAAEAVKYTQENKVLSVTGIPSLTDQGVTLGIGLGGDDKPKILLNLASSKAEGLNWNPAIMKIAKTVN